MWWHQTQSSLFIQGLIIIIISRSTGSSIEKSLALENDQNIIDGNSQIMFRSIFYLISRSLCTLNGFQTHCNGIFNVKFLKASTMMANFSKQQFPHVCRYICNENANFMCHLLLNPANYSHFGVCLSAARLMKFNFFSPSLSFKNVAYFVINCT